MPYGGGVDVGMAGGICIPYGWGASGGMLYGDDEEEEGIPYGGMCAPPGWPAIIA